MPIWLISALALIAPFIGRGISAARAVGTRSLVAGGVTGLGVAEATGAIDLIPGFGGGGGLFGGGGGRAEVRRRRKKALTNSDMATMALIASVVSKKAAENFVLMRVRR